MENGKVRSEKCEKDNPQFPIFHFQLFIFNFSLPILRFGKKFHV